MLFLPFEAVPLIFYWDGFFVLKTLQWNVYNSLTMSDSPDKNKAGFEPVSPQVNFPELEKERLARWYSEGIVNEYLHRNDQSDKYFSFMDGPITANNPMGVHHAWGRTYKDLFQRYKNMQGYKERFQNGFDCQGLWVEVEVEKELSLRSKKDIENLVPGDKKASIDKFITLCKERVFKFAQIQTEQTKRLGNFMDWDNSYFTLSDENNYMIWHFLKVCHERGWIYKGRDSVPWCPRCETAISQHEMLTEDYKEAVHESVFFALPVTGEEYELLVWTTTPWTVPANVAVAVHPEWTYGIWHEESLNRKIVILESGDWEEKVDPTKRVFEFVKGNWKKVGQVKGIELVGKKYTGPFDNLSAAQKAALEGPNSFHTVIPAKDLVTPHEGTGLVHIAPGAGSDDFKLGKMFNLPVIVPIDDAANYTNEFGPLSLQNAKKHPEIILDYLREQKFALATHHYKHRYPACWRCKTELVWKVADAWYISMDTVDPTDPQRQTLREKMKLVAQKITWLPEFGLDRELDWLSNMHDWLISKPNRYWGLALPIYECKKCGKFEVVGSRDELKEKAVEGWESFEGHTPHKPWIDEVKITCADCGETVERLGDVGNVWLDAGIVPFSTVKNHNQGDPLYLSNRAEWEKWFPIDFITESFPGQFKNWFYSLIAMSTVLENENPFKTVLGYGTSLAEDGRAMHKSWGNSIEFNEGADKMGADVMRWMFARTNPSENMLFGYKNADETRRQFHLKLWNIYNYFVTYANLNNWQIGESSELTPLDKWILSRLNSTLQSVTRLFDTFDSQKAAAEIEQFVDDLSLWYIRRSREREDIAFYATTYEVLVTLSKILAPITPFLADHIFTNLTSEKSVHLADWPGVKTELINTDLEAEMSEVRKIVEIAHAKRRDAQIKVRQPLMSLTTVTNITFTHDLNSILTEELNVKAWNHTKGDEQSLELDTTITEELRKEGDAREIMRMIQDERKKLETAMDELVNVALPAWPEEFEELIKRKTLISNLAKGEFAVTRIS